MADHLRSEGTGLSQALGRIASGLYILTVRHGTQSTGMLASWVQQAGFEPPMLTVAVKRDRFVADWIEASGRFTLNQLAKGSKGLIRHFGRGFDPDANAFEGLALRDDAQGGPVLASAMAYLDVELAGQVSGEDHRVFLGRIIAGGLLDLEAEPLVHVRANGLHY
ncbi:flavin reductase family protein [Singulisphaera sp. Ch08]|uniref:Flavin reductase family protein n=1 Tax=Singulisphaera sp. Ch08 TaxID=3120278 RepID=A0AAU7CTB7_9BACT